MELFSNWRAKALNLRRAFGTGVPKQLKVSKEKEDIMLWQRFPELERWDESSLPHFQFRSFSKDFEL